MRKKTITALTIIISYVFCVAILTTPLPNKGKTAHISIDDVSISFQELIKDSNRYNTIFENHFFSYLKELHDNYGCSFTLYCYQQVGHYDINNMPLKFYKDFSANSSWLRVGYHAYKPMGDNYLIDSLQFKRIYTDFNKSVARFAGKSSIAKIIRLESFSATSDQVCFLRDKGVSTLLTADDNRRSYDICGWQDSILKQNGCLMYNDVKYLKSDIRTENVIFPYICLLRKSSKDTIVVFTHEWKLDTWNKLKLERIISILRRNKYIFIAE